LGITGLQAIFAPRYANNKETYKDNQEAFRTKGRLKFVLYVKNIQGPSLNREGFFNFIIHLK
jgi:hypothetical protein